MRSSRWLLALLLAGAMPALAAVPESCERVRSDIQQKIEQPGAQVVGHCANDTFKILYTRTDNAQ